MVVRLNHHIVAARDRDASALFMTEMLGLPPPKVLGGHFAAVDVGDTSLDFMAVDGEVKSQHYAFLVSEGEFDEVFARIRERKLTYWADPFQKQQGEINHWDDGRGVYFEDPSGHLLEVLTRPYGGGGRRTDHPHPLVAPTLESDRPEGSRG